MFSFPILRLLALATLALRNARLDRARLDSQRLLLLLLPAVNCLSKDKATQHFGCLGPDDRHLALHEHVVLGRLALGCLLRLLELLLRRQTAPLKGGLVQLEKVQLEIVDMISELIVDLDVLAKEVGKLVDHSLLSVKHQLVGCLQDVGIGRHFRVLVARLLFRRLMMGYVNWTFQFFVRLRMIVSKTFPFRKPLLKLVNTYEVYNV